MIELLLMLGAAALLPMLTDLFGGQTADPGAPDDPAQPVADQRIQGSRANNFLAGTEQEDEIVGWGGADTIVATSGFDLVYGGAGADDINGNAGKDTLFGGSGNDLLRGDDWHDILYGGSGTDSIFGELGRDSLFGGDGDDILFDMDVPFDTGPNTSLMYGGTGNDLLLLMGAALPRAARARMSLRPRWMWVMTRLAQSLILRQTKMRCGSI